MNLPKALIQSLLPVKGFRQEAFEQVHVSGERITSVRFNPWKDPQVHQSHLPIQQPVPWTEQGFYLTERPSFTFDPLFHAGVYYVQEASSMFLEQALKQAVNLTEDIKVLDLCAAPGGKSTHLQSLLSPGSLLVTNEVIKTRAAILEENIVKWGGPNAIVTNNDPADFAALEGFFDVIVIDAPCSGSGLFRRDPEAIKEWSEQAVQLCSQRQQRILADSYPALKEGGVLIYSTCSYSQDEDEVMLDWLMQQFDLVSVRLETAADWGIVEVQSDQQQAYGYRFFPDQVLGEGLFLACFKKQEEDQYRARAPKRKALQKASAKEAAIVTPWLRPGSPVQMWKQGEMILAFPANLEQELLAVADKLYIRSAGITTGKIAGNQLVPEHALAVSTLIHKETVAVSLKKDEALQYLRKEPVMIPSAQTGWALVQYENIPLGWVKLLGNRINNYYPSSWRILKSGNN